MKKILKLILIVMMASVVYGCGNEAVDGEQPVNPENLESPVDENSVDNLGEQNKVEISGVVLSFNDQGMSIEKAESEELGTDDGNIMVTGGEENEMLDIFFLEETSFAVHEMNMDGEVTNIRNGSIQDLSSLTTVTVFGENQEDRFVASQVQIWINIAD